VCAPSVLPHALHIRRWFNGFSGISSTHLSLKFGIPLLLHLISLAFLMLILLIVGLTKKHFWYLSFFWIFSYLLVFSKRIISCSIHHRGRVCSRCCQILWIVHTMRDFRVIFEIVPLKCHNTSVISVAETPVFNKRMRHLERRHHFLRDHVEKGDILMKYIDTETRLADIFTKPLYAS
jgi:hypothetical protein